MYHSFGLLDILLPEQKLSIQIRQVNSIQIQKSYVAKASQNNILHCEKRVKLAINMQSATGPTDKVHSQFLLRPRAALLFQTTDRVVQARE